MLEVDFNSHPHEEDDYLYSSTGEELDISTHILTKRMTMVLRIVLPILDFNSHPHEEDDKTGHEITEEDEDFNSHPHEEDDALEKMKE